MKKRVSKKRLFLKILVALTVLSSMLVSTLFGVSKAEYFKSLSEKLDLEIKPDLMLEYYLYDATTPSGSNFESETGVYRNAKSFKQLISTGIDSQSTTEINGENYNNANHIIYRVKIPVAKEGYYTLDFLTYMTLGSPSEEAEYADGDFYTLSYTNCVGCEVFNSTDNVDFNSETKNNIPLRVFKNDTKKSYGNEPILYADATVSQDSGFVDSVYQWKTMCPWRAENVKLTFKATSDDVTKGYVIWNWDFGGLESGYNYTLHVEELSVNKVMNIDGTTDYRTNNDPYFMFPQTAYVNNLYDGASSGDGYMAGKTYHSWGRGTYVTEATPNSLGMRAEMLFDAPDTTANSTATKTDNPLGLYIPLKNVRYNTTYKVTFDFSVAKQGKNGPDNTKKNGVMDARSSNLETVNNNDRNWHDYSTPVLRTEEGTALPFQSYLNIGLDPVRTDAEHNALKDDITYKNKFYSGQPLTKYDEVTSLSGGINYSTSTNVNDTFSQSLSGTGENTINRNFFNAVWHDEYNGQYKIPWLTFYNTTFSFNIQGNKNDYSKIEDLFWMWEIEALRYTGFYNIRIENVRIQEVVDYSSALDSNGFKIGSTTINPTVHLDNAGEGRTKHDGTDDQGRDLNAFDNFKGRNSTGQNYQARAHATDKYLIRGNIYAPIVDASRFQAKAATDPYKIFLDGWAIVDGGVDKYVFSVDGGATWEDMSFTGNNDVSNSNGSYGLLRDAEYGINQHVKEQTTYPNEGKDWITFDSADSLNCRFDNWTLYADLSAYKHQANLDVIIAAVPEANTDLRCEILRIINFNQIRNYRTYTDHFVSDISVTNKTTKKASRLNACYGTQYENENLPYSTYDDTKFYFNRLRGWRLDTNAPGSAGGGYARHVSYSYDYDSIRTLFSDFPVYNKLSITGWAMVEGGVDKYRWSADNGKTWHDCEGIPTTATTSEFSTSQRYNWYDGVKETSPTLSQNYKFMGSGNAAFTGDHMLTADLSSYVGEVVDVIFCAKPVDSDVYVPVGRCDNVAVYGETGTFYTHINSLTIDGKTIEPTYFDVDDKPLNHVTTGGSQAPQWNLGYTAPGGKEFSYTIFEPNNVDAMNSRLYNNKLNVVQSGSQIVINGYTAIGGAAHDNEYMYTLDGGDTWNKIYLKSNAEPTDADKKAYAKLSDSSITNFKSANYYDDSTGNLTFAIPALPDGAVRNLTVVAKNAEGNIVPVLNIKLKIKNENTGFFVSDANGVQTGYYGSESISQSIKTKDNSAETSYKMTFPISREGVHTLTFNSQINANPVTTNNDNTVTATIVHDDVEQKGGERYYASTSNEPYNADSVADWKIDNPFAASDVELYFNATAEDVRRGYVVLDWDLSKLMKNTNYTLTIKNLMYSYGVKLTKHLTTDEHGKASCTIKVPALDVGTHEFAFSSYTSAYSPVFHQGLDQSDKRVDKHDGSNYKSAGAYMSVPKTVYNVGEPIHVSYSMAGAQTDYGQWIGISRAIDGRDAVIAYDHVHDNGGTEGMVTLKPGISKCEVGAEEFANLPAGDYKIYFRDFSANIYRGKDPGSNDNKGRYWPECNITDPISITIIDPNKKNDNPYKQTYYFDDVWYDVDSSGNYGSKISGWVSLDKTVFRVGEDITFNYEKRDVKGNPDKSGSVYVGFAEPNYTGESFLDTPGVYFGNLEDRKIDIPDNIAPGRYQLYCCDYSLKKARQKGSVIAVIDIVILPADGENLPTMDLTYAHQSGNSALNYIYTSISAYDYSRNPISIDVTEADVKNGFVEFKYELNNLVPNMDIVYTTEMFYNRKIEEVPYIEDGNYIYFGEYPQTLKLPSVEILENVALDYRGYYKGSDGYYYAKVVANPYGDDYIFANGKNYVVEGKTYYFKVEPIKWRILKKSSGYYDLLCESIIDNRAYDNDSNKYDVSDVRKWLNETFYKTAFSDFQKEYIMETTVDNSIASTGYAENNYTCDNTYDKVYLPSYADVTKNEYGFSSNQYEFDLNRIKTVTDYARATGAWINMSELDGNMGSGIWMLRSPADSSSIFIREGYYIGDVTDGGINISSNAHGVVPMLRLSKLTESTTSVSLETIITSDFPITKGTSAVNAANYSGASISVDKVYYEYGEDIPIEYKTPSKAGNYRVYITMDEKGSADRYGTWVVKAYNVNANTQDVVNLSDMRTELHSHVVPNDTQYWDTLPPGEYKIWLYDVRNETYPHGSAYNQYHAGSGFITESLSIKILPSGEYNPDFSVTHYSDWEYLGTNYDDPERLNWTSLTLDKTVFKQGEKIRYYIDGSWEHKWVGVFSSDTYAMDANKVEEYSGKDKTWRYAQWGHKDYINVGSNYLETETLTPGQYKIVYVFGLTLESAWAHDIADYNDHAGNGTTKTKQRVMTVIDITILPEDCGNQTVTVNYTKIDGTAGEKTLVKPVEFFTPVTFNTFLNGVLPESPINIETNVSGCNYPVDIIRTNVSITNYGDD